MACFYALSSTTVRGLLSCQAQLLRRGVQKALHAPLCHFECLSLCLCVSFSPGLSAQRHSAMMGFSDGIKMSRPTAVTHGNCIVYRFYHWEQPAVCFVWCLFSFFVMMSLSVALLLLSLMFQSFFNLSPCVFILLQVYRHSYMASYSIYNIHTR